MKTRATPIIPISLFSEKALVVLISLVTLLLQSISFATTWNGSRIYLEGIFPYASLFFAIAIQATAYFFSNSLRTKASLLKVIAMCTALCCSTYYSYIGIYNSVNSPTIYLQENYVRISYELTQLYEETLEENLSSAKEAINNAASMVTAQYTTLLGKQQNLIACRDALANIEISYTADMRPPSLSSYENYEDYAAAYQAYINGASQGNNLENAISKEGVLSSYGFSSIEELTAAELENTAVLNSLQSALGITADTPFDISAISSQLTMAINNAALGQSLTNTASARLNQLLQAAKLCGYDGMTLAQITSIINQCASVTTSSLLMDYLSLVNALPQGQVTSANTMDLKSMMDSEILSALIKINSLLPSTKQINFSDTRFQITDLYLIPVQALLSADTRVISFFCLAMAALIDILSVLFAISLRSKKPLWKKRIMLFSTLEDYAPLIYASLPSPTKPFPALAEFMNYFLPSPQTEHDGYMVKADMKTLTDYNSLTALLCQLNLAKIIPAGFLDNPSEILLLRARFVFWANAMIYEEEMRNSHE